MLIDVRWLQFIFDHRGYQQARHLRTHGGTSA